MAGQATQTGSKDAARHFGIAALQLDLIKRDNLARIGAEVAAVTRRRPWVRMIVLGELATFGADTSLAQKMPGPAESQLAELARRHHVWLIPGSLYERDGDQVFNTAPVIDPTGVVVARHRKLYPYYPYETGVAPGSAVTVFDVPGVGRFGVSICYDMWFPEITRSMVWQGAEVILHPTMTDTIDRDVEQSISRASAAINQCYFVDVNVAGDLGVGRSIICGPGGEVIHRGGSGREIIAFEVDLVHLRDVRERGWHCVEQPLKSVRDGQVKFPAYGAGLAPSDYLSGLGPLVVPDSDAVP